MSSSSRPGADDLVASRSGETLMSPAEEQGQSTLRAGRHAPLLSTGVSHTYQMWPHRDLSNQVVGGPSSLSPASSSRPPLPNQFEPTRYGTTPFSVSDMPAEARRQSIMAMDRKRRLTGSTHDSGRRRNMAGGFDDREDTPYPRVVNAAQPPSRMLAAQQRHNLASSPNPEVIDLTNSPPRPMPQSLSQHRRQSTSAPGVYVVPTWQPDSDVAECPICNRPFSFLFRRHHCRKCGRVVCNDCSPHRITIPRQFIVNPPGPFRESSSDGRDLMGLASDDEETSEQPSTFANTLSRHRLSQNYALGGGEKVRLCNPCVPDPQPEPHSGFASATVSPPRSSRRDDLWTLSDALRSSRQDFQPGNGIEVSFLLMIRRLASPWPNILPQPFPGIAQQYPMPLTAHPSRSRPFSTSLQPSHQLLPDGTPLGSLPYSPNDVSIADALERQELNNLQRSHLRAFMPPDGRLTPHHRYHSMDDPRTQPYVMNRPRHRSLLEDPLAPRASTSQTPFARAQLSEEDICPICRRALPAKGANGDETAREAHIMDCISSRDPSSQHLVRGLSTPQSLVRGPMHMLPFTATEKDCVGEDGNIPECSICMVEYDVGDQLARLECLCKFHRECIREWFMRKQECPVHKIS